MRNSLFTVFKIFIAVVLFGKILNMILNFSDEVNQILNITMFSLIGVAYIVAGYVWDHKFHKIIFITCGVFLIVMNFFPNYMMLDIIGIVCILTPMLIARFNKMKDAEINVIKSEFLPVGV